MAAKRAEDAAVKAFDLLLGLLTDVAVAVLQPVIYLARKAPRRARRRKAPHAARWRVDRSGRTEWRPL